MSDTQKAQASEHHDLSGAEGRKKLAELIQDAHICMLASLAEDGTIDARPMAVQKANDFVDSGALWFLTQRSSHKIDEVAKDRHVTLAFAEPKNHSYVSLKGTATVSQSRERIHELWSDLYKAWFPEGENDPNIAVMRVEIAEADYWSSSNSRLVFFAKYALAAATHGSMPVGESGHVTV